MTSRDSRWTAALILIGVGLGFFFLQRGGIKDGLAVATMIGALFLVAYLVRRAYGFLVPAGVLLGAGLGNFVEFGDRDDGTMFGLGCGFLFIYVVAFLVEGRSHWWPLIPGAILILGGVDDLEVVTRFLFEYWPLALVAVGLLILFGIVGGGRATPAE